MRTFDEALAQVREVQGWMSPDQAERLYRAAAATRTGDQIVEIGSFQGRSTIVLASAAPAEVPVVAIDPHAGNDRGPQEIEGFAAEAQDDHAVFNRNLAAAGVADRVRHVRSFSDTALVDVPGSVQVLYVDGASILYLIGSTMNWVEDDFTAGFVFDNPNAKGACGCGESFTPERRRLVRCPTCRSAAKGAKGVNAAAERE
jgi:iron-sulfur cluster assembly accessory protein